MVRLITILLLCFSLSAHPCDIKRDKHGKIYRDKIVVKHFMKETGYPYGRPGYVVDHIIPLCACGKNELSNLQWQSIEEAKKKDKEERKLCERTREVITE